jgi:preprotein translocase subunit SecG
MKAKMILWIWLLMQVIFLFWFMVIAPEPHGAISAGMDKIRETCPTQAAGDMKPVGGAVTLNTAGDFFVMADSLYTKMIRATMILVLLNIIVTILAGVALREKKQKSKPTEPANAAQK